MIPQPGLAVGIYANTRGIGVIMSGDIIAFGSTTAVGSTTALGHSGVFVGSGLVPALALVILVRVTSEDQD